MSGSAERPAGFAQGWLTVGILSLLYALSFIDRQVIALMVGPIQHDLQLTDTQMSVLLGPAFALFFAFLGLPMGVLVDRVSRRGLIAAGVVVWSLFTAGCGLARSFGQLMIARVGVGVGEAALSPSAYSLISDCFPPSRLARALSVFGIGVVIGGGLASVIGGYVIAATAQGGGVVLPLVGLMRPWQLVFLIVGLPGLALSGLMALVKEPVRHKRAHLSGNLWGQLRTHGRAYTAIMGGFGLFSLFGFGASAWIPTYLVRVHSIPIAQVGLVIGLGTIIFGSAGTLMWGAYCDRLVARGRLEAPTLLGPVIGTGLLLGGVMLALAPTGQWAMAGVVLFTMFGAVWSGIVAAALQIMTPRSLRGRISAVYMVVVNAGGLGLGPLLVALATDRMFGDPMAVGRSIALVGCIVVPLGCALLWFGREPYLNACRSVQQEEDNQP